MRTFTKTMVSALALAFAATAMPTTADARPNHHKRWEKARKHHRKAMKRHYKHSYKHSYRPPRPHYYSPYHRYRDRDYENESFRIYSTPYGGLGFSYSKSEGDRWW